MKKQINRKKGAALEITLLTMIIVFVLTTLILSISIASHSVGQNALNDLTEKTLLSQIAKGDIAVPDGYEKVENGDIITISKNGKVLLSVTLNNGIIIDWKYSL